MYTNKFIFLKKQISVNGIILKKDLIGIAHKNDNNTYTVEFTFLEYPLALAIKYFDFFDPQKTGDSFPKKVCNMCCRLLDTENFSKNQNGKNNRSVRRPSCDECRKIIDGVPMSTSDKHKWQKTKPHMTIFECPICKKKTIPGLTSKVVLDHDHKDGHIRGWICDSCNTGIGRFKDDVELLQEAITYLKTN